MNRSSFLRRKLHIALAAFALMGILLSACGGGDASPVATPATDSQQPAGSTSITGAGATFPNPLYSRWFYEYAFIDPSVRFNYQSIGSGGGIKQITERTVDFGASDAILNADQFAAAPGIQMFPMVAGADVPTYNLSELKDLDALVLDADTLAGIFLLTSPSGMIPPWLP